MRAKRRWRYSRTTQYHYWEDDKYGYGDDPGFFGVG